MDRRIHDPAYVKALELRVRALEQLTRTLTERNQQLAVSAWFGCLTRNGLDQTLEGLDLSSAWFVFFDVDKLKALNDKHGKPKASQLIGECIKPRAGDMLATYGQWFSGDEFAAVLWSEQAAIGYAQRVQTQMHNRGFSATFVVLPATYRPSAQMTLAYADGVCNILKQQLNKRDLIVTIGG